LYDVKSLLKNSIFVKEIKTASLNDQFHFHNAYEIALILKGSGRRVVGDSVDVFSGGDLVMIGPNIPHANYSDKENHDKKASPYIYSIVIYFQPDWFTEQHMSTPEFSAIRSLLTKLNRGIKINDGETHARVVKLMQKLKNTGGVDALIDLFSILNVVSKSNEYSFLASPRYAAGREQGTIKKLHEVYKYVMEHFTEDIQLDEVASIVHMSTSSFCRYFKRKTQKTFIQFVNEIRIGYASELLIDESLDIAQVCYQCGFNNFTSFNKNFKRFTQKTPSEYRTALAQMP
jgi:AraC-like DNA-binding protein